MKNYGNITKRLPRIWCWSMAGATIATVVTILQDALFGGLPSGTPLIAAAAQYALPWFSWAALAPAILFMFEALPVEPRVTMRTLALFLASSLIVVALKLVISAPLTALLIWRPMHVGFIDGLQWLLAHRSGENLIIFWLLAASYTAFRYYKLINADPVPATLASEPLTRIPVRKGEQTGFVDVVNVVFAEAERNQLAIHTTRGRFTTRTTLHELERRLPSSHFLRVHRSRLINLDRVDAVEPWGRGDFVFILNDGTRVVSGKTYREAIRRLLNP